MATTGGIYGLSGSGMDIDDMVKKMMQAQQARYDKMYKSKVKQEWQKSAYNTFYSSINNFRFNTLSNYKMQSTMAARAAKSSDEGIVSVNANGDAAEMTHDIAVTQLAQNAYLQSTQIDRGNASAPTSINLPDILDIAMPTDEEERKKVAISFVVKDSNEPDAKGKLVSYTYNDLSGKTLNDLASDINKLGLNVSANYDATNDSFSLSNKKGGESNGISISVYTGGIKNEKGEEVPPPADTSHTKKLFDNLNLASYDSESKTLGTPIKLSNGDIKESGKSATAIIDGKEYKSDTNQITAAGVTYTLNKISNFTEVSGKKVYEYTKVNVTADTDTVVNNVKKFVEDYNKMIDSLNESIYQASYKEYQPLTEDEKKEMSEDEIKKWEEKAKSGLLYHDEILRSVVSDMRSALSQPIDGIGKYNSAASIGITTGDYTEHGKIHLDETKLRNALAEDSEAVYKIFGTKSDDGDSNGIANRLNDAFKTGMDKIALKAGSSSAAEDQSFLGTQITSMKEKMTKFQKQMEDYQARLYKQFNAMETAIASLNSQYNFVTNYTSGS